MDLSVRRSACLSVCLSVCFGFLSMCFFRAAFIASNQSEDVLFALFSRYLATLFVTGTPVALQLQCTDIMCKDTTKECNGKTVIQLTRISASRPNEPGFEVF